MDIRDSSMDLSESSNSVGALESAATVEHEETLRPESFQASSRNLLGRVSLLSSLVSGLHESSASRARVLSSGANEIGRPGKNPSDEFSSRFLETKSRVLPSWSSASTLHEQSASGA